MDRHHHRGRMSLLRLRGEYQFSFPLSRSLWNVMHEQAVSRRRNQLLPISLSNSPSDMITNDAL